MRPTTVLALALVVAVLGVFIWVFERDVPSTEERRELEGRVLPVEASDIHALDIEWLGVRTRLERLDTSPADESEEWRLSEPLVSRADAEKTKALLSALSSLEKRRELTDFVPAEVGLESPRSVVTLFMENAEWRLSIGSDVPATADVVVSVAGRGAFVTSGGFLDQIKRHPDEWRSREVIPGAGSDIRSVRSTSPQGELVLVRESGHFSLESPVQDDADEERVSELLEELSGLEVEEFLGGEIADADRGLDPPLYEIAVTLEGRETPLVVGLGLPTGSGESRFATAENQHFTVETDLAALLDRPVAEWQSLDWTTMEPFEVDSVRILTQDIETRLERVEGEWRRDGGVVPYSSAMAILDAITSIRAEGMTARGAMAGIDDVDPTVSLVVVAGDRSETLTLRPSGPGSSIATREGRDYSLEVPREKVDGLLDAIEAVLAAAPDDSSPE